MTFLCICSLLMMVIGVSNMIGRILSGAVSDIPWVNSIIFNSLSFLATGIPILTFSYNDRLHKKYFDRLKYVFVDSILGLSIFGFVFCRTFVHFLVVGACFGLSFSCWQVYHERFYYCVINI